MKFLTNKDRLNKKRGVIMKKKIFAWLLATMLCIPTALQSTAAEKPTGDINADGVLDIMDVILLQKWLLAVPETHIADPEAGDFDADGTLDVFDLALMKKALVDRPQEVLPPYEPTDIDLTAMKRMRNLCMRMS